MSEFRQKAMTIIFIFCLASTLAAQDTRSKAQTSQKAQSAQPLSADFVKAARRAKNAIDNIPCTASSCREVQKFVDDASVEATTEPEKVTLLMIETYQISTITLNLKAGMNPPDPRVQQLRTELNRCSTAIDAMLKRAQFDSSVADGCHYSNP
jgi:hypothetical protein